MSMKVINNIVYMRPEEWRQVAAKYPGDPKEINPIDFLWAAGYADVADVAVGGLSAQQIDWVRQTYAKHVAPAEVTR